MMMFLGEPRTARGPCFANNHRPLGNDIREVEFQVRSQDLRTWPWQSGDESQRKIKDEVRTFTRQNLVSLPAPRLTSWHTMSCC